MNIKIIYNNANKNLESFSKNIHREKTFYYIKIIISQATKKKI